MKILIKILSNQRGWVGAAIGAGAGLLGGVMGANSAKAQNEANLKMQRENQAWQEKMSNTAHQREQADLKAAGLNPILGLGGGGASTGSAQMIEQKEVNPFSGLDEAVSSALESRRVKKEEEAADNQNKLTQEQTNLARDQANKITDERAALATQQKILQESSAARQAENAAREANANLEKNLAREENKHVKFDAIQKRTQRVIDGVSSAVDIINPLKGLKGYGKANHNSAKSYKGYTEEQYNSQGEHVGTRSRRYND